jgi:hypothetical protein
MYSYPQGARSDNTQASMPYLHLAIGNQVFIDA